MDVDHNALQAAITAGLPIERRWMINDTPLDYDFSVGHRRVHKLTEKEIGADGNKDWLQLVVFGEHNFAEGRGARPWLCVHKSTGAVHGLDGGRDDALFLLNTSIDAFVRTFQYLDEHLGTGKALPPDAADHLRALDPQAYQESEWRLFIEDLMKAQAAPKIVSPVSDSAVAPVSLNAAEIKEQRSNLTTSNAFALCSFLFVPLSVVGGVALMWVDHRIVQAFACTLAMLGPFAGLAGLMLMAGDQSRYRRALAIAIFGDKLGLRYTEPPNPQMVSLVNCFYPFEGHTDEAAHNCLAGEIENTPVVIMDYSCSWGRGGFAPVKHLTVFVFPGAVPRTPDLLLSPKSWLTRMASNIVGGNAIQIPGQEQVNKAYNLYSAEPHLAASVFTGEIAAICLQEKKLVIEVRRGALLIFWSGTMIKPRHLQERFATVQRLMRLMRQ
jgi:SUKH-4 immunity protein of toxin-antitoxin system